MSNAQKKILMTSMSKQIINEMGHKQCIILNLKMKKIKRQNPSQQVSNNSAAVASQLTEKEIESNFKLQTIYIVQKDQSKITIEKYNSDSRSLKDHEYKQYINLKENIQQQDQIGNANLKQFFQWQTDCVPIYSILNDQQVVKQFISSLDYQPQHRNITFNIVCEIELETIEFLERIGIGQKNPRLNYYRTHKKLSFHNIQPEEDKEEDNQSFPVDQQQFKTLIASGSPKNPIFLLDCLKDQNIDCQTNKKEITSTKIEQKDQLDSSQANTNASQSKTNLPFAQSDPVPDTINEFENLNLEEKSIKSQSGKFQKNEAPSCTNSFEASSEINEMVNSSLCITKSLPQPSMCQLELPHSQEYLQIVKNLTLSEIEKSEKTKLGVLVYAEPQIQSSSNESTTASSQFNKIVADDQNNHLSLLATLIKESLAKPGKEEEKGGKKQQQILIVSPSQSLGEILFNELAMNNIVQLFGQKKALNKPYQQGIPIAANFFGRTIQYIEKRTIFQKLSENGISLSMMSPKQAYDYLQRRIIRVDDFRMIIFQDLSSFNDKHHQWLAEDFYQDCQLEKRPVILSLFSQKPKAPQEWLDWLQTAQKSFCSKLLRLELSTIELIENLEMKTLLRQGQQSVEMTNFNQAYKVPKESSRPAKEWLRFHEIQPAFKAEDSAAITLRDALLMLRSVLEVFGKLCSHEHCKNEVTEGTLERIEESRRCDPKRLHSCMHMETTNKLGKGEMGYKCVLIVLPHCVKRFLNDIDFSGSGKYDAVKCPLKRDCEGFMCFEVLKQIIKMGLVDQHSHINNEVALKYIQNGVTNKMIQQNIMSQEDTPKTFTNISNDYIQRTFQVQAEKKLYVFAAVNHHKIQTLFQKKAQSSKSQKQQMAYQEEELKQDQIPSEDSHSISQSSQSIGFLFPDNRLQNKDMKYEMQIDPQQRHYHMEYLVQTGLAKDLKEAFKMTKHHEDIMPYNLGNVVIEFAIDQDYKNLQELKCFHIWSMHSISNMESVFIRNLLKGKYTFGKVLFKKEIQRFFKRHPEATQEFASKFNSRHFTKEQLSEAHHYVVPLIGKVDKKKIEGIKKNVSELVVNVQLIQQVVTHIRTQIINSFIQQPALGPHKLDLKDGKKIKSYLWSQSKGMKQIVEVTQLDDKLSSSLVPQPIPNKEMFSKYNGLTYAQNFLVTNGFQIDNKQSNNLFKFRKNLTFVDTSATKTAYSLQDKKVQKEINNVLLCKDKDTKIQLETMQSKAQTHTVPAQLVETYPLNYEIYSILQSACSHYLKLNDFLRTEEYIKKNFTSYPPLTKGHSVLNFDASIPLPKQAKKDKKSPAPSIHDILLDNLSLVNASLTAPQTQLAINNERLKTYGDSLLSLLYSVDIYLNRSSQDTEKDLDSLRKQYNSKQNLDSINIRHKIYEYQLVDCQSQQPVAINPENDSKQKIVDSVCNRHYTIHKNVIPGALGDNKYYEKMKNTTKYSNMHTIFLQKVQIESLRKQSLKIKEGSGGSSFVSVTEFKNICEILNLIFSKKMYLESFKMRFTKEAELFYSMKGQYGPLIENYASLLISDHDITLQELQAFLIEQNLEKMQKPKHLKPKAKPFLEESKSEEVKTVTQSSFNLQKPSKSQNKQAKSTTMTFQINNDQKLGEAIEALLATVTLTCGVQEGLNFMRHLGVFKNDLNQLQQKVDLERNQQLGAATATSQNDLEWIQKVESIVGYKFGSKDLVQQAFQHQTYCSFVEKNEKIKLKNYNLLEFIGDSVMNFLVVDFYFKNSQRSDLSKIYGHDQIHKLKTELTNNNFIAIAMIELGLHEYIKKKERSAFNNNFANFVQIIQESLFNDKNGQALHTQEIYKKYFVEKEQNWLENPQVCKQYKNCIGKQYVPKKIKFKEVFMEPTYMKFFASITENERITQEETEVFHLKIFADVFEALIGAIFIDTGCDLKKTREVFMNFFEPYLYVYGNLETVQDHPKTELIQYWNKFPYGKIHSHSIAIIHTNHLEETSSDPLQNDASLQSDQRAYIYKGFLGSVEVLSERYEFQVKNKVKQFYRYFLQFVKDLEKELSLRYPYFQKDLEALNKMEKMKPETAEYASLASQLRHGQSLEQLHQEVIKSIIKFKEKWNSQQSNKKLTA